MTSKDLKSPVVVAGSGVAGYLTVAGLAALGVPVVCISPSFASTCWWQRHCCFKDEVTEATMIWLESFRKMAQASPEASVWKYKWSNPLIRFSDGSKKNLNREYVQFNSQEVHKWITSFLEKQRLVTLIHGRVSHVDAISGCVYYVTEGPGDNDLGNLVTNSQCKLVQKCSHFVDATGPNKRATHWQRFFGLHIELLNPLDKTQVRDHNLDINSATVCDFGVTGVHSGAPLTQCYTLPLSSSEIFMEEFNICACSNPPQFNVFMKRLKERMKPFEPYKIVSKERYSLPLVSSMGTSIGSGPLSSVWDVDKSNSSNGCRVSRIGAAGGMIHSSSGYMLAFILDRIPKFVSAIAKESFQKENSACNQSYCSASPLMSQSDMLVARIFNAAVFYLDKLSMSNQYLIENYFRAFFSLQIYQWSGLWARSGVYAITSKYANEDPNSIQFCTSIMIDYIKVTIPLLFRIGVIHSCDFISTVVCAFVMGVYGDFFGARNCHRVISSLLDEEQAIKVLPSSCIHPPLKNNGVTNRKLKQLDIDKKTRMKKLDKGHDEKIMNLLKARNEHISRFAYADSTLATQVLSFTFLLYGIALFVLPLIPTMTAPYYWISTILWILFRACITVRATAVFHDTIHGSFYPSIAANRRAGWLIGLLIGVSPAQFRHDHLHHHAHVGDYRPTKRINLTETIFFTFEEYKSMSWLSRIAVRILRDPVVFFFISGPIFIVVGYYVVVARSLFSFFGIGGMLSIAWMQCGWFGVCVELVALYIASMSPLILSQLMHAANPGYAAGGDSKWSRQLAHFEGSTFLNVPSFFKWVTLGLEEHCIHHANPKVPCYRLTKCRETARDGLWKGITVVSFIGCGGIKTFCNTMWSVEKQQFVTFAGFYRLLSKSKILSNPLTMID